MLNEHDNSEGKPNQENLLNEELIDTVKLYLERDVEVCGYIEGNIENQKPFLVLTDVGNTNSCVLTRYYSVIWHTHPKSEKGYPSTQDILKVLKHEQIRKSLVFTTWGIWIISNVGKTINKHANHDNSLLLYFQDLIQGNIDRLYRYNERGRKLVDINKTETVIKHIVEKINKHGFSLEIDLIPW
jgi:hypothetical protein